eukprot:Opistho-2@18931
MERPQHTQSLVHYDNDDEEHNANAPSHVSSAQESAGPPNGGPVQAPLRLVDHDMSDESGRNDANDVAMPVAPADSEGIADAPMDIDEAASHQEEEWVAGNEADDESQGRIAPFMNVCAVRLPPDPRGEPAPPLAMKVRRWHSATRPQSVNAMLNRTKDFRNPNIYEKLVSYFDLCETGTNYPLVLQSGLVFGPESYYEELAKAQVEHSDRRERQRREQQHQRSIQFVHSGRSSAAPSPTPAAQTAMQNAAAVAARLGLGLGRGGRVGAQGGAGQQQPPHVALPGSGQTHAHAHGHHGHHHQTHPHAHTHTHTHIPAGAHPTHSAAAANMASAVQAAARKATELAKMSGAVPQRK